MGFGSRAEQGRADIGRHRQTDRQTAFYTYIVVVRHSGGGGGSGGTCTLHIVLWY